MATPPRRAFTLAVVLAVAAAGLGLTDLATRADVGATDAQLAATLRQDRVVRADLAAALDELSVAQGQQSDVRAVLHQINDEITATNDRLASTRYILGQETTQVDQLNTCLSGVVQALNQLSVHDTAGAVHSLQAIQPTCQQAQQSG